MWNNRDGQGFGDTGAPGGGYMNSPGYGSSQQAGSQQQQQQRNKRIQNLVPCSTAQLLSAQSVDDNFVSDGIELGQIRLIGLVKSAKEAAASCVYEIDDMTGPPIEVRHFVDNDESTPDSERVAMMRVNTYVRVTGHLRSFQGKRVVVAINIRALTDMNELTSHLIEIIYARVYHKKRGAGASVHTAMDTSSSHGAAVGGAMGVGPQQSFMGQGQMKPGGQAQMAYDVGLNPQQQQVLNVLRTCSDETGISINVVCAQLKGLPPRAIREAIDFLSSEGHIYSTIDDDHYKATDSM